jgi:hypothetical protein
MGDLDLTRAELTALERDEHAAGWRTLGGIDRYGIVSRERA